MRRCSGGGLPGGCRRDVGASDVDDRRERGRVVDGELGEVLAVDLDTGGLEALDEPVVGHAVGASSRVDALDPQLTKLTLARPAVAVGVVHRVEHLLLGLAVEPRALAAVAAGALEYDATLLVGIDCPLHACHGNSLLGLMSSTGRRLPSGRAASSPSWCRRRTGSPRWPTGVCGSTTCARAGGCGWRGGASACRSR